MTLSPLPIDDVLPELRVILARRNGAVLQAPPGAGKTTGVPLALIDQAWCEGKKIIMLEPRRLAARAAARRMAQLLGEDVGNTVGYRVRLETKVSARTRIEVVTEGILIRRLQHDPGLDGVGLVIFDEFHERSLDGDLGLALCLEAQGCLREDLKILVMSATLDGGQVAALMNNAPVITSEGRAYPVVTHYLDKPSSDPIEKQVSRAVLNALQDESGSILVFLPGAGEIRRVQSLLQGSGLPPKVIIAPLFGNLTPAEQDLAIGPTPPGRRKIVLATSIAETSLTIEGIRVVIDSGLMRIPRFDPASAMTRLETIKVSQASADQRRGRAGRMEPGICYRLWTKAAHRALIPFTNPEITDADLTPLALELALWGVADAASLKWLTPPPQAALQQARELLHELGGLDRDFRITAHGRALAELPLHPRLAHLVLRAGELGRMAEGARLAALLEERPILKPKDKPVEADIHRQCQILGDIARGIKPYQGDVWIDHNLCERILKSAQQISRLAGRQTGDENNTADMTGPLVALAYPDRIAQRRQGSTSDYLLVNGRGAYLNPADPLAKQEFLAVADMDGQSTRARIYSAAALERAEIEEYFGDIIETGAFVRWDARTEAVIARKQRRLGEIILKDSGYDATPEDITAAVIEGIRLIGIDALPWTQELENWQHRVLLLRHLMPEDNWPDVSDSALMANLPVWLAPYLGGITRCAQFGRIDLKAALHALLDWTQTQSLEKLTPTHVTVPSGSHIPIDYTAAEVPVLAVRLQEMFGATETPAIAGGRLALMLHLLSPARRPVQITRDLKSFWSSAYLHVKSDLKGRYPKHYWPDNPLEAEPTARAKRRSP